MKKYKLQNMLDARKRKGLSQENLADICGCSQRQISQFENCIVELRSKTIIKIANELGLTFKEVVECKEVK